MKELDGADNYCIGEKEYESTLKEDLYINSTDLGNAFADHAERYSWYATAYELAINYEAQVKVNLERYWATLYNTLKSSAVATGAKVTEKSLESKILTDDIYLQLQDSYLLSKRNTGLLKAARDAMIHRKDMLVQSGATYRAEVAADVSLKAQHT